MTSQEKVAYLRGLIAGMELDPDKKETKLFNAIADVLSDLAQDLLDVEDDIIEMGDQLDDIDEDITALETVLFDLDDDDDDEEEDEDDEDEDDEDFFGVNCPECGNLLFIDDGVLAKGEVECPSCSRTMYLHSHCDGCDGCDADEDEDEEDDDE